MNYFLVAFPGDDHDRRSFQEIVPRVFEAPAEIIGVAMFRDRREVLPWALESENSDVMPHPEEGEHGGGKYGQEDDEERHGGILDGDLRDHLVPPIDEKDPCQDYKEGMEYALNCQSGSAL